MWFENINSHVNCNWDLTVCWNVACWKMPQSALGLCVELLCNQQFSIIGGQCQCQNKAPTAPNRSKLSLQMSLRCQLKSFSWNRDDGALTTAELMCRPEEERLNTSARDKQTNRDSDKEKLHHTSDWKCLSYSSFQTHANKLLTFPCRTAMRSNVCL